MKSAVMIFTRSVVLSRTNLLESWYNNASKILRGHGTDSPDFGVGLSVLVSRGTPRFQTLTHVPAPSRIGLLP